MMRWFGSDLCSVLVLLPGSGGTLWFAASGFGRLACTYYLPSTCLPSCLPAPALFATFWRFDGGLNRDGNELLAAPQCLTEPC